MRGSLASLCEFGRSWVVCTARHIGTTLDLSAGGKSRRVNVWMGVSCTGGTVYCGCHDYSRGVHCRTTDGEIVGSIGGGIYVTMWDSNSVHLMDGELHTLRVLSCPGRKLSELTVCSCKWLVVVSVAGSGDENQVMEVWRVTNGTLVGDAAVLLPRLPSGFLWGGRSCLQSDTVVLVGTVDWHPVCAHVWYLDLEKSIQQNGVVFSNKLQFPDFLVYNLLLTNPVFTEECRGTDLVITTQETQQSVFHRCLSLSCVSDYVIVASELPPTKDNHFYLLPELTRPFMSVPSARAVFIVPMCRRQGIVAVKASPSQITIVDVPSCSLLARTIITLVSIPSQSLGGLLAAREQGGAVAHTMMVSRVVWDHIVAPSPVMARIAEAGPAVPADDCVWVMAVAEALFPLVPRACRAIMGASALSEETGRIAGGGSPTERTSRYAVLQCAATAGSTRCIEWILRNKVTRNNVRECVAVLKGLCAGGHMGLAQELFESGDAPWRGGALRWPVYGRREIAEEIREVPGTVTTHSLLFEACRGGHLEAVKWVISTFGVDKDGMGLVVPFIVAVLKGHSDVVKWLASSTCAVTACIRSRSSGPIEEPPTAGELFFSTSLEVMKLCADWFHYEDYGHPEFKETDIYAFLKSPFNKIKECCDWLKEKSLLSIDLSPLDQSHLDSETVRWWVRNFPDPREMGLLLERCCHLSDPNLLEWSLKQFPTIGALITPETFIKACGNEKDSVSVLLFLLPKVTPPPLTNNQLRECLVKALGSNNTSVADWLEAEFHVMDSVNAMPGAAGGAFSNICHDINCGVRGLQWFLSHATLHNVSEHVVQSQVSFFLFPCRTSLHLVLLLLKSFNIQLSSETKRAACQLIFSKANISQAKQLVASGDLSEADFLEALAHSHCYVKSGKVVKWVLQHFHLNEQQVKAKCNYLLALVILVNKTSCAEWIIHEFNVTLSEVAEMNVSWGHNEVESRFWKMILRVFPQITASFAKKYMLNWATATPLAVKITIKTLGFDPLRGESSSDIESSSSSNSNSE
ncbi:hypothetical protein Pelo_2383 [Pelomyxa schiedti]|nr:hypothetical protein Pelo_2383 [Pelomyxa schiedti]